MPVGSYVPNAGAIGSAIMEMLPSTGGDDYRGQAEKQGTNAGRRSRIDASMTVFDPDENWKPAGRFAAGCLGEACGQRFFFSSR